MRLANVLVLVCFLLGLPSGIARSQVVPESSQLPIFFKLLTYDRTLWDVQEPRLRIGVLHRKGNDDSYANLTAMVEVLTQAAGKTVNNVEFEFATISWSDQDDLARKLGGAEIEVLYVTSGHEDFIEEVIENTRSRGILTLTGSRGGVVAGLAVGIDLDGDRPRIEVNLSALDAEGHQLDSRVLRLCKVVQR
ncbi:MAG: YfiR family protein [Gemmatimonadales bacterium]|nr:YfiR family protein [Gemmatimonadales bacterium]